MAYGITSEDQIIDLNTIEAACEKYKTSFGDLIKCADKILEGSKICDQKALSFDNSSFQWELEELAAEIKNQANKYIGFADSVISQARLVYNSQVQEYNEYVNSSQVEQTE